LNRYDLMCTVLTSRPCLILVLFLGIPVALGAQTQQRQWSDLNGLKVGHGIEAIESNMKSHGGEFVAVTDEVITLREKSSDVSAKREDVARISTASGARRGEHAVIGLVAGGLIGAGIGAMSGSSTGFFRGSSRGIAALVGIVIGAPSGAAVGAVLPAHTTIYRAEHRLTIRKLPFSNTWDSISLDQCRCGSNELDLRRFSTDAATPVLFLAAELFSLRLLAATPFYRRGDSAIE
jgi:hypothetical protein